MAKNQKKYNILTDETKTSFQFLDRLDSSQEGKKQEMYSPELETFRIKPGLEEKTEENGKQIVQPEAVSAEPTKP